MFFWSLASASVFGFFYAYLFLSQQKLIFGQSHSSSLLYVAPLIRLVCIVPIFYYLLHLPILHSILTLCAFLGSWWVMILIGKNRII